MGRECLTWCDNVETQFVMAFGIWKIECFKSWYCPAEKLVQRKESASKRHSAAAAFILKVTQGSVIFKM